MADRIHLATTRKITSCGLPLATDLSDRLSVTADNISRHQLLLSPQCLAVSLVPLYCRSPSSGPRETRKQGFFSLDKRTSVQKLPVRAILRGVKTRGCYGCRKPLKPEHLSLLILRKRSERIRRMLWMRFEGRVEYYSHCSG